jgi:general secretion pathway protein F
MSAPLREEQVPIYDYQGLRLGAPAQGQIAAGNVNEALKFLSQMGVQVQKIQPAPGQAPVSQPVPRPAPSQQPSNQTRKPAGAAPQKPSLNLPPMADPLGSPNSLLNQPVQQRVGAQKGPSTMDDSVIRTKPAKDSERSVYFVQLADMTKGGIPVPHALTVLADRVRHDGLSQASLRMAAETGEGRTLADSMARYPDLFLPGHVGGVRAGESGGYLPDAFQAMADQSRVQANLNKRYWWAWVAFLNTFLVFLIFTLLRGVVVRGIDFINGKNDGSNTFFGGVTDSLLSPWGILFIILTALLIFISWAKNQTFTRPLRHKLGAKFPILKKRTHGEALSVFTWHLSRLAKAGLSPFRSWNMAAEAVPNMEIAGRLTQQGRNLGDSAKLSDIYASLPDVSWEVTSMVQTGEMTGRLGEALDQASAIEMAKAQEAEKNFTWRLGCWAALVVIGGGMLGFMIIYGTYLNKSFEILETGEDEPAVSAPISPPVSAPTGEPASGFPSQ